MSINGLLTDVRWQWTGTETSSDLLVGDTVIPVVDPECASAEDSVWISGTGPYEIVDTDVDGSTFTITPGLTVAVESGDEVALDIGGSAGKLWVAEVILPDAERPVEVPLTIRDISVMRQGTYDPPVNILVSDDLERVVDVVGGSPSIDGGLIEEGTLSVGSVLWEKNDRYYEALLAGGTATQVLKHKGIALEHEFMVFINGVALAPENYTLDADNGIVTVTIPTWVGTDSDLWFHYAYRDESPLSVVPFTYVGKTTTHAIDATSLAWPAGTQVGDLAIVGVIGRSSANQAVTDKRFTVRENLVFSADRIVVATAVVTDLATPVAVSVDDLGAVQEANSMLLVIRPTEPIRFVIPPTDSGTQVPGAGTTPAVSDVSGAVGVFFTIGGIGGAYGWSWPAGWTSPQVIGTYSTVNFALAVGPNVPAWRPTSGGFGDNWRGFSIGLGMG